MSFNRPTSHKPAAKVKFRVKGQPDGPIYEGQRIIIPCKGCGKSNLDNTKQFTKDSAGTWQP